MVMVDEYVKVCVWDDREVAYVIEDACFPFPLAIRQSDNAWWMDVTKVQRLIDAFKLGHLIKDARFYAGITERQWEYFNTVHPDFWAVQRGL